MKIKRSVCLVGAKGKSRHDAFGHQSPIMGGSNFRSGADKYKREPRFKTMVGEAYSWSKEGISGHFEMPGKEDDGEDHQGVI